MLYLREKKLSIANTNPKAKKKRKKNTFNYANT